jgi:hypothetical protein
MFVTARPMLYTFPTDQMVDKRHHNFHVFIVNNSYRTHYEEIQTTAKDIPFVFVGELYNLNATIFWINNFVGRGELVVCR